MTLLTSALPNWQPPVTEPVGEWTDTELPLRTETWLLGKPGHSDNEIERARELREAVQRAASHQPWQWPKRRTLFFSDPHADADAFVASLLAAGAITLGQNQSKKRKATTTFKLTRAGRRARFIIGGDCLDKGPSNLGLLRSLKHLIDTGADAKLLAGNHDMRLLVGLRSLDDEPNPLTEHLFVRMSPKAMPLLQEVYEEFVAQRPKAMKGIPDEAECRRRLLPRESWYSQFPEQAGGLLSDEALEREVERLHKKASHFDKHCKDAGMGMREIYATAKVCQKLFLHPKGEFSWFFDSMKLAHKSGSFLFVHAGLDDSIAALIAEKGIGCLNKLYRKQIRKDLFTFYYGTVANTMRTKYRPVDMPLSDIGVARVYRKGIHAVVHGHRNRHDGQRLMLRQGLLHIEGDTTLDRHSRKKEGLSGIGASVTVIEPSGRVIGISNDYPFAKVFEPEEYLR